MNSSAQLLVGLGEALFDCFENVHPPRKVLGGAPLNAAAIAHQLGRRYGVEGVVVSRVGDDALGERLRSELTARGMRTDGLQRDLYHPTGRVLVQMHAGEPQYEIVRDVAWDFLEWDDALQQLAARCGGVTFGTLAQRSDTARQTIQRFLHDASRAFRLFDVNFRQRFYSADVVREGCERAEAIKLNTGELFEVARLLEMDEPREQLAAAIARRFELRAVILTHGAEGTELIVDGQSYRAMVPKYTPEEKADPVGAGDACGAVCLTGLMLAWPPEQIVAAANRVAAYVASRNGATPTLPDDVVAGE